MGQTGGFYISPGVFADMTNDMSLARKEIFGPVLAAIPFDTEAEALAIANDTIFGLAVPSSPPTWTAPIACRRRSTQARSGSIATICRISPHPRRIPPIGLRTRPLRACRRQILRLQDDLAALFLSPKA